MTAPLRVLAIDIEGGHGGSSRSLLQSMRGLDRGLIAPEVWCRHGGAIEAAYRALDIPVRVTPDMPRLTALDRDSRNLIDTARFFLRRWPQSAAFRRALAERIADTRQGGIDLVHLNHVSLFWLARWLRREFPALPVVMHIRTQPVDTIGARWQSRVAARACSNFVYITENERDHFARLSGSAAVGSVIYNPVAVELVSSRGAASAEPALTALCLSNFSMARGTDRIVDLAAALDRMGDRSVRIVAAGDMHLSGTLPGALGRIAKQGGTLADYAAERGVADRIDFPGHVSDPERLLAEADVLLKPTRDNNPWGRDILEGLGHGLPVASVGTYDRFVETGVTGLLQPSFDADELAAWLIAQARDRDSLRAMGRVAAERISDLCDPARQAAALARFWIETAAAA